MIYSHSRLSCFEQCPLKFKYKYIDKIEPKTQQTIEAFMGSIVHKTLEKLYRDIKFQKKNTLQELLNYYNDLWRKNWNESILIVRREYNEENFRKMGEQYIRDYYKKYYPFDQGKIIGLEKKVLIKLDKEGKYKLQGVIDRLMSTGDGKYEIHDYKTNFELPSEEYLHEDRQLALYAIAVLDNYQDAKEVKLIWHFLSANKEVVIKKTREQLEKLKLDTINLIEKIEREKEFKQRVSKLCDWCEFRDICPEWKHISKTENLEPNKFLKDSGVKLVNKYVELKTKREKFLEEIDSELNLVREAIIKFCEKEKINSINGSNYILRVWSKDVVKFKNDEKLEKVKKIIKENNLWEELSKLDTFKLSRIYDTLPKEVIKKLDKFKEIERVNRIYIKEKEDIE